MNSDVHSDEVSSPDDFRPTADWEHLRLRAAMRKAADQGLAQAQFALANSYYYGKGVPQDYADAVRWYRRAADQGDAKAQYGLASTYYNGKGIPQDYAEAVRWCRKAAEHGHPRAEYRLGAAYYKGQGVPKDYAEAVRWYRKAAEHGYATAQYELGFKYWVGLGVPRDDAEAVRWFRKAANQGHRGARCALLLMYFRGQGAPLVRLSFIGVILLAVLILAVPRGRREGVGWVRRALVSVLCAAVLGHECLWGLWIGWERVLAFWLPAVGAAVFAVLAVVEAVRGSKSQPQPPEIIPESLS